MKKILVIEGTTDDNNGNLRVAFSKLLFQEEQLKGRMPQIIMGDGKNDAIAKFHHHPLRSADSFFFLLVDLDEAYVEEKEKYIKKLKNGNLRKFYCENDNTYFMVQEMEAWILSQPEILEQYYKIKVVNKLRGVNAALISNPSDFLKQLVGKQSGYMKSYHKVKDCVKLLPMLDLKKLRKEFEEVDAFLTGISKESKLSN